MATISTTTSGIPLDYPSHASIARDTTNGDQYVFGRSDNTTGYRVWKSTDNGATWNTYATFTRSNLIEWSSIVVDKNKFLHIAYRVSTSGGGGTDLLFYRRLALVAAQWGDELQVSATDSNGGTPGSYWQGVDIAVVRHNNGAYAIAVVGAVTVGTSRYGVIVIGVSIANYGLPYLNNPIINGNRYFTTNGTAPGRTTPVCEIEHNGDGITSSNPALWVSWGRTKLFCVKLAWLGTARGWNGPASFQTIDSSIPSPDYVAGRWDGTRWMMVVPDTDLNTTVDVYQRNQANNQTTLLQSPVHPTGVVRTLAISYDSVTKDIRLYAVGTSTAILYYVDYVRASGSWGTWTAVSADAISATPPDEYSAKRGGTFGNSRHDIVYTTGTVSPYTLKNIQQVPAYAPNTPTWDTSAVPYVNGGAADVAASLLLDWNFRDTDPADTQSAFALRRQVGAGAFAWWRVSDSTWQAVETFNSTATSALTLASAWALDADATYQFWVKTRDSTALDSGYSEPMVLVPSAKVNPAITAPLAAAVLVTSYVTMTWTAAQQTQYRSVLKTGAGVVAEDTGWVTSTDLAYTPAVVLGDGTAWTIELTTKNNEGLASTTQTRAFTIDYTEPPSPTLVAIPDTANGRVGVVVTNPAPSGTQPALAYQEVYRRVALTSTATLNANPSFAGNVTGWTATGAAGTYSTTQFHDAPGSARVVPTGAAANSYVESAHVPFDRTLSVFAGAWVRPDTINKPVQIQINFYTSGGAFLAAVTKLLNPPVAAVWQYFTMFADAAAYPTAARVSVAIGMASTPAAGDAAYVDEVVVQYLNTDVGTRVASGLAGGVTVLDWRAGARTPYEWRAAAYGANGTMTFSPWTP